MKVVAITLLTILISSLKINAQITGYDVEVAAVHYGEYGDGVDLNGYITYDLFVTMTNEDDFLSAIFAFEGAQDINFNFTCNLFQHEFAGITADNNNCSSWSIFPSSEYDSFLTIGKYCGDEPGSMFFITSAPSLSVVGDQFEGTVVGDYFDGGDLFIEDGSWFTVNELANTNGVAGADLKVLIARFTTCGDFSGCFGAQVFIHGVGADQDVMEICIEQPNPCVAQALDTTITVIDPIACFGECETIQVGTGVGNGNVNYQLWCPQLDAVNPILSQVNNNEFCLPGNLDCYIAMEDAFGCKDTTNILNYIEPDMILNESTLVSDESCAGELAGEILTQASGGLSPYVFSSDSPDLLDLVDGESWTGLSCLSTIVTATDANGCQASQAFDIACPEALAIDIATTEITCYGYDNGSLIGQVTGGTGQLSATWNCLGDSSSFAGGSPLDISMTGLGPCSYELSVVDVNGCQIFGLFGIEEPPILSTDVTVTDVSCFGSEDGAIDVVTSGGTPEVVVACTPLLGGAESSVNLPAGQYLCTTTDGIGCQVWDTVMVNQPLNYTFDFILQDASCFGGDDGAIFIENISGGEGEAQLSILEGNIGSPVPSPDFGILGLPSGSFNLVLEDSVNGCQYTEGPYTIGEPAQISIDASIVPISCFGFNDGTIEFSCNGGTGGVSIISPINGDTLTCPSSFLDLVPGDLTVQFMDDNGCTLIESYTIDEPELLVIDILSTTDVECGGDNTGAVEYDVTGGTGDYNYELNGTSASIFDLVQLYAGQHELCVFDQNLCQACDTFTVVENPPILITLNPLINATCTGMTDGSVNLFVQGGVGNLSLAFDPPNLDLNFLGEGSYTVFAQDELGCQRDSTWVIGVDEVSDITFEIFTSPVSCWNENDGSATVALTGGNPPVNLQWSDPMNQTSAAAVGLPEGLYYLNITDAIGCTFDTSVVIEPTVGCFFIANAITPNGDGSNDTWLIGGLEYFPSAVVTVLNRWGQVIYQSKGYVVPWDGSYNGQMVPVSDYYYVIEFEGDKPAITGTVTVKY